MYNDTVLAGTTGYTQKYRLRMWIDYDANYIVQTDGEEDSYPLQDKSYALMVNVYGEGNDIGESEKATRENTHHIQGIFSKIIRQFLILNLRSQKAVG